MADWSEKYNKLLSGETDVKDGKQWRWSIEEHKQRGTLQLNVRLFSVPNKEGGYEGPTKNGFITPITNKDDLESIRNFFNEAFDSARRYFE